MGGYVRTFLNLSWLVVSLARTAAVSDHCRADVELWRRERKKEEAGEHNDPKTAGLNVFVGKLQVSVHRASPFGYIEIDLYTYLFIYDAFTGTKS